MFNSLRFAVITFIAIFFRSIVDELAVRLGFDASLVDIWFLTFRDLVIVFVGVLTVESEATTPSRNVGNQVPSDAASYPEERFRLQIFHSYNVSEQTCNTPTYSCKQFLVQQFRNRKTENELHYFIWKYLS